MVFFHFADNFENYNLFLNNAFKIMIIALRSISVRHNVRPLSSEKSNFSRLAEGKKIKPTSQNFQNNNSKQSSCSVIAIESITLSS